jgi:hypothetical protein
MISCWNLQLLILCLYILTLLLVLFSIQWFPPFMSCHLMRMNSWLLFFIVLRYWLSQFILKNRTKIILNKSLRIKRFISEFILALPYFIIKEIILMLLICCNDLIVHRSYFLLTISRLLAKVLRIKHLLIFCIFYLMNSTFYFAYISSYINIHMSMGLSVRRFNFTCETYRIGSTEFNISISY